MIPTFQDLEVFLQTLPRSATGERMNPYNSIWTGVTPEDGPQEFHVVLLDNGRTKVLADREARETLDCIRCGACLNACPVYRQTGGHAYGSVYGGPIGAILTPQLQSMEHSQTLPYASSLCGACYEVCPVKINIPEILVHLRGKVVEHGDAPFEEKMAMKAAAYALRIAGTSGPRAQVGPHCAKAICDERRSLAICLSVWMPGQASAICPPFPTESFREWWVKREREAGV